jgi:hypothetical protein
VVNDASALIHLTLLGTPVATDLLAPAQARSGDISGIDLTTLCSLETTVQLDGTDLTEKLTFTANPASLTTLAAMLQPPTGQRYYRPGSGTAQM